MVEEGRGAVVVAEASEDEAGLAVAMAAVTADHEAVLEVDSGDEAADTPLTDDLQKRCRNIIMATKHVTPVEVAELEAQKSVKQYLLLTWLANSTHADAEVKAGSRILEDIRVGC